jgi:hypothetical protein
MRLLSPFQAMHIEITDPALIDDLVKFLQNCQCKLDAVGRSCVEASPPAAGGDERLCCLQIDGFLRVWCALHPGVHARFDGQTASRAALST